MVEIPVSRRALPRPTAWWVVVAIPLAVALFDPAALGGVLDFAARALGGTLPYILAAVLMIAGLKATGAERAIGAAFEGRESRAIVLAALMGGLAPFCSCEVIPFIAGLLAVGVPLGPVMAFWLASPLIDPPSLAITAGALGWDFAIGKAVSAVALGLFGGFAMKALSGLFTDPLRPRQSGGCGCGAPKMGQPVWRFWEHADRRAVFGQELRVNGLFLLKWLTLAYLLEALMVRYVPAGAIAGLVGGDGVFTVALSAVLGMPAYLNSYAAPALVDGLMAEGMSASAAMAFMIGGAVSSIPAMAAVWSLVRPQVFAVYLGLGFTGATLAGLVFGMIV
ncbi:permease [Pontivivens ytuae]|uniref:Permease n=1 Tax=Pontivivens ytuae TaxID=2789856 RepID=A0A7S9LTG6_9RHOB|nr:permease [Pontivivens ytuae]QPH54974.1 permease [Pontivivens ytuae]